MSKYKKNYYIFKFYLKGFCYKNRNLYCFLKDLDKIEPRNIKSVGFEKRINAPVYEKETNVIDNNFSDSLVKLYSYLRIQHKTNLKLLKEEDSYFVVNFISYLYSHNHHIRKFIKETLSKNPNIEKYINNTTHTDYIAESIYNSFKLEFSRFIILNINDSSDIPYSFVSSDYPVIFFDLEIEPSSGIYIPNPYGILDLNPTKGDACWSITVGLYRYTISYNNITKINFYTDNIEDIKSNLLVNIVTNENTVAYCPLSSDTSCFLFKKNELRDQFYNFLSNKKMQQHFLHILNILAGVQARNEIYSNSKQLLNFLMQRECANIPHHWKKLQGNYNLQDSSNRVY